MADEISTLNTDHPVDEVSDKEGSFCFTANGEAVHQVGYAQCGNRDLLQQQLADIKTRPWANDSVLDKFKSLVESHPVYQKP